MMTHKKIMLIFITVFVVLIVIGFNDFYCEDDFIIISDFVVISMLLLNQILMILKYDINKSIFKVLSFLIILYILISTSLPDEVEFANCGVRFLTIIGLSIIPEKLISLFIYLHLFALLSLSIIEVVIIFDFLSNNKLKHSDDNGDKL